MPGSGYFLLSTPGLLGLLALAIPILIHLFNKSRGRLVKIGHIGLVRQARKQRVTEIRLAQYLLLALRLGIFTLAALILAELTRQGLSQTSRDTIYLAPAWLKSADDEQVYEVLQRAGQADLFLLAPGFTDLDEEKIERLRATPLSAHGLTDVWPNLAERLGVIDHRGGVDVYSTDWSLAYGQGMPALPRTVEWHIGESRLERLAGAPVIRAIVVYDVDRAGDAAWFLAALETLKKHRLPKLSWQVVDAHDFESSPDTPAAAISGHPIDWLIFLSSSPLPADAVGQLGADASILSDMTGEDYETVGQTVSQPRYPFTPFQLHRFVPPEADGRVRWQTDSGLPVLLESNQGLVRRLMFQSRFHPHWNSLVLQPEFPELLLQLMISPRQMELAYADARIAPSQLALSAPTAGQAKHLPNSPLQTPLALLLVLLWITERFVSERTTRDNP